jgi:two-component system alkaline phosphatase synthesis response regulator PhoP
MATRLLLLIGPGLPGRVDPPITDLESVMKTILVVDDEPKIVQIARDYLEHAGFGVSAAFDGRSALGLVRSEHPDLIVLDLGLPDIDGLDVTRALRKETDVPIIMLTARADESDKLVGLELGADDYMTKPFSPKELVARVRVLFRRLDRVGEGSEMIRVADLTLDTAKMSVQIDGQSVDVTATEFQLLAALARQPGRIFTRTQLLDAVRGVAFESYERAIDAHIKNIRRKIEPDPREPRYILTVYGVGYKFADR